MVIILYILAFILIAMAILYISTFKEKLDNLKKIDIGTEEKNKKIDEENKNLIKQQELLLNEKEKILENIQNLNNEFNKIQEIIKNSQNTAKGAYEQYCDTLDELYNNKDIEIEECIKILENAYEQRQQELAFSYIEIKDKLNAEVASIQDGLDKLAQTRAAAIEAQRKEKEIKDNKSFYCVKVSDLELSDIKVLSKVRNQLNQPRILNMLIWSTYFQKPMTSLCNNVLGTNTITGIYKITNQLDDMCYIGQSVDIAKRWKDHAKCGLGIDTPLSNKLYKAMLEDGLQNFSFELLEECSREDLDEKERFYINLYQSYEYGYNSNKGNK